MRKRTELFFTMLKIGLFTFGGGYAMLALLQDEIVEKKRWLSKEEFLDMAAIAESTPGPIAINAATYLGYTRAGLIGALVATLGVCIPSFGILYAISLVFDAFLSIRMVAYAFKGIQVCVVYLILSAGLRMWNSLPKTGLDCWIVGAVILGLVLGTLFAVQISTVFYILACGVLGLAVWLVRRLREGRKDKS